MYHARARRTTARSRLRVFCPRASVDLSAGCPVNLFFVDGGGIIAALAWVSSGFIGLPSEVFSLFVVTFS